MENVKLHQLCSMKSGGTPSRGKSEYYGGTIPWSKISDLEKSKDGNIYKTEEHITTEGLKSINSRLFKKGTLLLAMYGSVGKTAIAKIDLSTNQAILGINIKDETKLDIKYLRFWFTTIKEKLLNRAVGGTLQNISMGIVKDLEIPLPSLPTQQKIAAILDKADELRQYYKQLIEKYDALTQSLFLDMFGDPVKNEKGWEVINLNELCIKITDGTHKTPKYLEKGVVFLSAKNIKNFKLNCDAPKHISQEEHQTLKNRCMVENGDILITKSGSLGMAAKVQFDFEFSIFESLALIKYIREKVNGDFLLYFLNTESTQQQYIGMTKGVGVKHLHLTDLRKIKVINPPVELQEQFAKKVNMIENQRQQAQEALIKSEDLFQSLLKRAFKGELN